MKYQELNGNLITLAQQGKFDVIGHGVNCQCVMGAGLAPQMAKAFGCDTFNLEHYRYKGDVNKLGQIDYAYYKNLIVVNCYSQYDFAKGSTPPVDYEALTLCFRKINHEFKGKHIGLPQLGCGLAGGSWTVVKEIIQRELKDCRVTVVIYK